MLQAATYLADTLPGLKCFNVINLHQKASSFCRKACDFCSKALGFCPKAQGFCPKVTGFHVKTCHFRTKMPHFTTKTCHFTTKLSHFATKKSHFTTKVTRFATKRRRFNPLFLVKQSVIWHYSKPMYWLRKTCYTLLVLSFLHLQATQWVRQKLLFLCKSIGFLYPY